MKALSLTQPWASLIGDKLIETRGWATGYRGPLAIHATREWTERQRAVLETDPFWRALQRRGLITREPVAHLAEASYGRVDLPLGAIVSVTVLVGCARIRCYSNGVVTLANDGLPRPLRQSYEARLSPESDERAFGNYRDGRYAWLLKDVQHLPDPIPCKGALGLWSIQPPLVDRIAAQVVLTR